MSKSVHNEIPGIDRGRQRLRVHVTSKFKGHQAFVLRMCSTSRFAVHFAVGTRTRSGGPSGDEYVRRRGVRAGKEEQSSTKSS